MKTMKTMKTILSVCMITLLLYACTKSDTPPLDCMGVENGLAAYDDCQVCHESYMYMPPGGVTYVATYADTVGKEKCLC
jgi:hypothetical protein